MTKHEMMVEQTMATLGNAWGATRKEALPILIKLLSTLSDDSEASIGRRIDEISAVVIKTIKGLSGEARELSLDEFIRQHASIIDEELPDKIIAELFLMTRVELSNKEVLVVINYFLMIHVIGYVKAHQKVTTPSKSCED